MKSQSYMTRALQARDPRFARILGRLGYETKEGEDKKVGRTSVSPVPKDDIATLRAEYTEKLGKRPFNGWDAATLREKIADASV